jgi:hypothetical protein
LLGEQFAVLSIVSRKHVIEGWDQLTNRLGSKDNKVHGGKLTNALLGLK